MVDSVWAFRYAELLAQEAAQDAEARTSEELRVAKLATMIAEERAAAAEIWLEVVTSIDAVEEPGAKVTTTKAKRERSPRPAKQLRAAQPGDLIDIDEVAAMLGVGKTKAYERVNDPGFPPRIKPNGPKSRATRWSRGKIQERIDSLPPEGKS